MTVRIITCRLFGSKLLSEAILDYCYLNPWGDKFPMKFEAKYVIDHTRKYIHNIICKMAPRYFLNQWWLIVIWSLWNKLLWHDDVIKWKHCPRNWPFVRGIHRSPVNFPHKGQWRGALMLSVIYAWINDWVNNREAGDLRRQHGHYYVIVMNFGIKYSNRHAKKLIQKRHLHNCGHSVSVSMY